jgi:hypothetical protein
MKATIRKTCSMKEVKAEIDKDAFKGPFPCCRTKTRLVSKHLSFKGFEFSYDVWKCLKCGKEYMDSAQAAKLERFWTLQKIMDDKLVTMERSLNFDGKTFFFRFPKELTATWGRSNCVDIKLLSPEKFLVEVKGC